MIAAADLHLTDKLPKAVDMPLDNFIDVQLDALEWLFDLALEDSDQLLLVAGDWWDYATPGWKLFNRILELVRKAIDRGLVIVTIPGQHDLLYHNIKSMPNTSIQALATAFPDRFWALLSSTWELRVPPGRIGRVQIYGCPFGAAPAKPKKKERTLNILLWHHLVVQSLDKKAVKQQGAMVGWLLRNHSSYDLIITGDNHKRFDVTLNSKTLINPGAFLPTDADQQNFKSAVYQIKVAKGKIHHKPILVPQAKHVKISRDHISKAIERDARIEAFTESLRAAQPGEGKSKFKDTLELLMAEQKAGKFVHQIIYEAMEK